jgi:hypothetical protein
MPTKVQPLNEVEVDVPDVGKCRAQPPVVIVDINVRSDVYPMVPRQGWCGEWAAREGEERSQALNELQRLGQEFDQAVRHAVAGRVVEAAREVQDELEGIRLAALNTEIRDRIRCVDDALCAVLTAYDKEASGD